MWRAYPTKRQFRAYRHEGDAGRNARSGKGLGITAIGLNPWSDQLRYTDVKSNLWANDVDKPLDVKPSPLEQLVARLW